MSTDTSIQDKDAGDAIEAAANEERHDAIIGKTIDCCVVKRKLGQGGMGVVYLAEHETLKQEFVLKILNPALTGAEDTVDRFFREAQACAQLNHSGIVAIQNVGQEGDLYFIRMEYVEGDTLEDQIKRENQLDWRVATQMVIEVAEALSHAHQKGMIHRDIKPENIMCLPDGSVKVMDFGLAKHVHSSAKVSVTGQIVGTPFFMSPEQAGGKPTDARSDIYSLGVTLYYLVTGVKPFNGKNLQEIFLKHFFYAPESPKIYNEALPESLCEVVKRCLKKKKKERYQSAKALARDLQGVLDDPDAEVGAASPTAAAAAADSGPVDADKTVVSSLDEDVGATVRVEADVDATLKVDAGGDDDGLTVRVDGDDGGATVKVAEGGSRDRGGVGTVSFGNHNEDGGGATVKLDDDEEPAHAGLDLPQDLVDELKGQGGDKAEGPKRNTKKIALIVGGVILVPILFLGLVRFLASGNFNALKTQYDTAVRENDVNKMRSLATQLTEFAATNVLAPGLAGEARDLAGKLDQMVASIEKQTAEQERIERERIEQRKVIEEANKKREAMLAQMNKAFQRIADIREAAEAAERNNERQKAYESWKAYVEQATSFLEAYRSKRLEDKDVAAKLDRVRFPVFVNTDPPGAEVTINGKNTGKTTFCRLDARPDIELRVKVHKDGFIDQEKTRAVEGMLHFEFNLIRKELREAIHFGKLKIPFGGGLEEEALVPSHSPVIVEGQREAWLYYVGHGGQLRGLSLKGKGRAKWDSEEPHKVGEYGDPTPQLCVVEGVVVLAASTRGFLSAHSPQNGMPIWPAPITLDAPATSTPIYKRVFHVIAVGTASGRVYFVSDSGDVKGSFSTDNPVVTPPYFHGDRFCLIGSTDNRLYCVDWKEKVPKELHRIDLGSDVVAGPTPLGRRLIVGTASGQVHLISVSSAGQLKDEKRLGDPGSKGVTGIQVAGDKFFFTAGRRLYAGVNDENGARLSWEAPFNAPAELSAPLVPFEGDMVYVGCEDGTLYAVDKNTGEVRWRFSVPGDVPIQHPPLVSGGELYVLAGDRIHILAAD